MYKEKKCIALIFDRSYLIWDVMLPMGIIFSILNRNGNDCYYVYGGIPRLEYHLEEYARNLKINKDNLIKICLPYATKQMFYSTAMIGNWVDKITEYPFDELYLFRDNSHTNESSTLVAWAKAHDIPICEYDNRGNQRILGKHCDSEYYRLDDPSSNLRRFYKL